MPDPSDLIVPLDPSEIDIPEVLPVLALRDLVVFPSLIVPLSISRDKSIKAVEFALASHKLMLLLAQTDEAFEEPSWSQLYRVGTVASISRMLKLPDGRIRVLIQGVVRARIEYPTEEEAFFQAKLAQLEPVEERAVPSLEIEALMRSVKSSLERSISLGKPLSSEIMLIAANLDTPGKLADLVASNLDLKVSEAQGVLEMLDPVTRLKAVNSMLVKELELLDMQQQISTQARSEMDKSQRQYYLRQQLKAIQAELGEASELAAEAMSYREKLAKRWIPRHVRDELADQIDKLERMHPDSAETATLRNYLDLVTSLPWNRRSRDTVNLVKARQILDSDHYGLEKVKERILDYLAVRKLSREAKGPILCFVGPPGVGKTSLGRSIARALGRKFVNVSLGGVRDEAEIRGHRRTYVGALPGRIIQGIHQAGTSNPVFVIDEVDKIGADFRGDPSAALLEVLDPEQNSAFRDHYVGIPYDLSRTMFIATANLLDPIHPAFRDRMEVIHLEGYTEEDKIGIARRFLLPKLLTGHGLPASALELSDTVLRAIIGGYTREAGLRNLERELATLCRKAAREVAEGRKLKPKLSRRTMTVMLGPRKILTEELLKKDQIGVATGLAWTPRGGEILFVEACFMRGRGELILTGQLGDVMKESARAALSYLRAHSKELAIAGDALDNVDVHVHIPEGAIPKDGPSAGITIAVTLCSGLTRRAVRKAVAMTGELTLRGNVLPIGGVRHKVLAARRAGIKEVILPLLNKQDVKEIPASLLREMTFHYVEGVREVLKLALV